VTLASARVGEAGALVVVDGPLDYHATEELADLLAELSASGASRIAIDLERASPVDDATIGVLFRALRAARDAGGALAIGAPEPRLRDALATMGVDRVLRVTDGRVDALEALGLETPDGW
jgi:anti-sigma B factor antagonist